MQGMIVVSIAIHLIILMHIAGIYKSENLTFIELSIQDISKPGGRMIPRPRIRHTPPEIPAVKQIAVPSIPVPIQVDPVDPTLPDGLMETIAAPEVPSGVGQGFSDLFTHDSDNLLTRKDYLDMLRMKIERSKQYPEDARKRYIEGRVTVRFTLTSDGQVSSVSSVRLSGNSSLDQAAINAVYSAAPFARPPSGLFKGPVTMELTIVFELT